jgi:transcriptional regulator with XRE-family HTH domain
VDPIRVADQRSHPDVSPTRLRVIVGARLRRLREAANLTTDEAAEAIRGSKSKISRLERGKLPFKPRDLDDLLTLYDASDSAELLTLAESASRQAWWADYTDAIPAGLETYLGFEQAASLIRGYDAQFVPVLLQSRDYARTLIELTDGTLASRCCFARTPSGCGRSWTRLSCVGPSAAGRPCAGNSSTSSTSLASRTSRSRSCGSVLAATWRTDHSLCCASWRTRFPTQSSWSMWRAPAIMTSPPM